MLANGSNTVTTLASFSGTNGYNPVAGVTIDAQGNMYGTTVAGGAGGAGGLGTGWELAKGSNTITSLATFTGPNGEQPTGGVVLDAQGNLYGTAGNTLWEIVSGTNTLVSLASFAGFNGGSSYAGLTLGANGELYGATLAGGDNGDGTVFVYSTPEPSSLVVCVVSMGLIGGVVALKRGRSALPRGKQLMSVRSAN